MLCLLFSTLLEIFVFYLLSRLFLFFCVFHFVSRSSFLHWLSIHVTSTFYSAQFSSMYPLSFSSLFWYNNSINFLSYHFPLDRHFILITSPFSYRRHSFFFLFFTLFFLSLSIFYSPFGHSVSLQTFLHIFLSIQSFPAWNTSPFCSFYSVFVFTHFFPLFTQSSFPSSYFSSAFPFRSCPIFRWASYTSILYVPIK